MDAGLPSTPFTGLALPVYGPELGAALACKAHVANALSRSVEFNFELNDTLSHRRKGIFHCGEKPFILECRISGVAQPFQERHLPSYAGLAIGDVTSRSRQNCCGVHRA
jgi:hypothetical protein